jgi:hypothetical protein
MLDSQRGFRILAAITITISAFLLFQVQPLIGKIILPWFGGSPAVWTSSMLFFQVLLLAGYAYADLLVRWLPLRAQLIVHGVVLIAAMATLPIMPGEQWKPENGEHPMFNVLKVLTFAICLPYFAVSATAPLVQAWYARTLPAGTPYRLYSLSNLGSLVALLSYPFIVERVMTTKAQSYTWSALFVVFAICCLQLGWLASRKRTLQAESTAKDPLEPSPLPDDQTIRPGTIALWLGYPALAVVALLALTNHLCRDVAVVPFLWIAPLTLYLLSFIICFDRDRWYAPRWWSLATLVSAVLVLLTMSLYWYVDHGIDWLMEKFRAGKLPTSDFRLADYADNMVVLGFIFLLWLFCACMLCHGELVRRKPPAKSLTLFYLCVAIGGALGGLFVALICPNIFYDYFEFNLVQIAVCIVAGIVFVKSLAPVLRRHVFLSVPVAGVLGCLLFLQFWVHYNAHTIRYLIQTRNFYGVLKVQEMNREGKAGSESYELYHGRILHGIQLRKPSRRREPTTYYVEGSGPALAIHHLRAKHKNLRIGVLGLGTGSISSWAEAGDTITFYEINPNVPKLQGRYFTYLEDCPAKVELIMGDARIKMESQPPQHFDILFMDAFSGDAVPTHLLTKEAVDVYRKHLKPDGILAIHVSNRYLVLDPVVYGLARYAQMHCMKIFKFDDGTPFMAPSEWMLLSYSDGIIHDEAMVNQQAIIQRMDRPILWTDQYSNLFDVIR